MHSSNPNNKKRDLLMGLSLVLATGSIAVAQMTPGTNLAPGAAATGRPTHSPSAGPTGASTEGPSGPRYRAAGMHLNAPEASPTVTPTGSQDLIATAEAAGHFKSFLQAVQTAGLNDTLKGPGPFTVFAPSDEAFAKLPPDVQSRLQADPALLQQVLLYHVVSGHDNSNVLQGEPSVVSEEGETLTISKDGGALKVEGAKVVKPDDQASNGVIHEIDTVLIPPSLASVLGMAGASPSPGMSPSASPSVAPSNTPSPVFTIVFGSR